MVYSGSPPFTYRSLRTKMLSKGRYRDRLHICNNTWAYYDEPTGNINLYHFSTRIITYTPDDKFILRLGGWYDSVTSKQRINRFSPVYVFSDRGNLVVWKDGGRKVYDFFDGITVDLQGNVLNSPQPNSEVERRWKARERVALGAKLARFVISMGNTTHTLVYKNKVEIVDFLPPRGKRVTASFGYGLSTWRETALYSYYNNDKRVSKFVDMAQRFIQPGGYLHNEWVEYNLTPDDEKEIK